jgi:hypothetical protein
VLPAPGGISGQPLFVASDDRFEDGTWKVNYGYGFGMVVAFGPERTRAASMVPFGASEDPDSPHFSDQMALIQDRRLKTALFDPAEVTRLAETAYGSIVRVAPPGMDAECVISARDPVNVTTEVFTDPPAPLPTGLATFTIYARIVQEPITVPSAVDLRVTLAPELCAPEHVPYLAVYAYDSTNGWSPVEAQEVNYQTRTFICRDRGPRTYAVLGPEEYRPTPDTASRIRIAASVPGQPAQPVLPELPKTDEQNPVPVSAPLVPAESETRPPTAEPAVPSQAPPPLIAAAAAADPSVRQGAITWGANLKLRPPDVDGLVEFRSDTAFGARLIAYQNPPAPLPDGMAAFTEFVAADCQSTKASVNLTVHLRVAQDVCSPDAMENLSLYALSPQGDWERLSEQSRDSAKRQFTAKDATPRIYAVLGPQALRLKAPTPMTNPALPRSQ